MSITTNTATTRTGAPTGGTTTDGVAVAGGVTVQEAVHTSAVPTPAVTSAVHTVVDSPCGPLTLVAREGGLAGLYMTQQRHRPAEETFGPRTDLPVFEQAATQLAEYFAGDRTTFDLDLRLSGTPFQQRVWSALRDIPYGETVSYGELADVLGQPGASRAVGLANGKNPVGIIVPCHRVIGASGGLTGYGGGLDRKRWLLAFERGLHQPTLI